MGGKPHSLPFLTCSNRHVVCCFFFNSCLLKPAFPSLPYLSSFLFASSLVRGVPGYLISLCTPLHHSLFLSCVIDRFAHPRKIQLLYQELKNEAWKSQEGKILYLNPLKPLAWHTSNHIPREQQLPPTNAVLSICVQPLFLVRQGKILNNYHMGIFQIRNHGSQCIFERRPCHFKRPQLLQVYAILIQVFSVFSV